MIRTAILAAGLALVSVAPVLAGEPKAAAPAKPAAASKSVTTAELKILGMHCEGCSKSVAEKLKAVPGVKSASVDHKKSTGTVKYDAASCKPEDLLAAVKKAGYMASVKK